jgi:hypothetical protein
MVLAVAIAVAALLAAIWGLWWRMPQRRVAKLALKIRDPKDRADIEDNFRKTIGQALGGAVVLAGAAFAYLQFTQQQQAAHDQLQAANELRISNQVAKGFEQLAAKDNVTMRLGGIYGLEGVMNTSEQYRVPVLEALCAFVRDNTRNRPTEVKAEGQTVNDKPATEIQRQRVATDIQAALTVIGRRSVETGIIVDLSGANLSRFAHLFQANLNRANLSHADLSGADLGGASLSRAYMSGVTLGGANLHSANLSRADLGGATLGFASLSGANLHSANLSRADLGDANLNGANLFDANLNGSAPT